jgi:hypothetical protein
VSGKKDLREEIESLTEGIICYVSINCADNSDEHEGFGDLVSCYRELVRVWMVGKIGGDCKFGEDLRLFCPVVSDGVREGMVSEGFGVGYLAGVVTCEAFLLRLCLKFGCGFSRVELEKELLNGAAQMISAFRSYYFVGENGFLLFRFYQVLLIIEFVYWQYCYAYIYEIYRSWHVVYLSKFSALAMVK